VFSVTVFTELLGNILQQWTFLCFRAYVLAGWRPSHANLLLFLLPSHDSPVMPAGLSYSFGTDPTGITAFNSYSVVTCVSGVVFTWLLLSHCLATGVFTEPFPSSGCLSWLHNSGFQQTCHNIYTFLAFNIIMYCRSWVITKVWSKIKHGDTLWLRLLKWLLVRLRNTDEWMFGLINVWVIGKVNWTVQSCSDRRIQEKQNNAFKWVARMRELGIVTQEHIVAGIGVLRIVRTFSSLHRLC
jgi:hypothetical protein